MFTKLRGLIVPLLVLIGSSPVTQPAAIAIHAADPIVRRIMFDPQHPRDDMPALGPHESAITQFHFDCRVKLEAGRMLISTALEDVIFLPLNATLNLREHEEGHREINERLYRCFVEELSQIDPSSHQADSTLLEQSLRNEFLVRAIRANTAFDEITNHGKVDVVLTDAIDKALTISAEKIKRD